MAGKLLFGHARLALHQQAVGAAARRQGKILQIDFKRQAVHQKQTDKDYLMVVAANISGGKTDSVIRQELYHQAEIQADGSILDSVIISRRHFGPVDRDFTDQPNRSYLRVYVPLGSELVKAAGFNQPDQKEFKKNENFLDLSEDLEAEFNAQTDPDSQTRIYD